MCGIYVLHWQISNVYGRQAVVISVDPKRVYVTSKDQSPHEVVAVCCSVLQCVAVCCSVLQCDIG